MRDFAIFRPTAELEVFVFPPTPSDFGKLTVKYIYFLINL